MVYEEIDDCTIYPVTAYDVGDKAAMENKGRHATTHQVRQRIVRPATPEEKERHQTIRQEIEADLPELKQWAKTAAAQHQNRVAVGTVFTAEEAEIVQAIDAYAASHSLQNRGAVVRDALAHLLRIEVSRG